MTNTTTEKKIFNSDLLQEFADTLKNNGFEIKIHVSEDGRPTSWFYFIKDNKIGYCQTDEWKYRLRFSTVHKPNRQTGTGYGLQDSFEGLSEPTIKDAEQAFIFAPEWAYRGKYAHEVKSVVKFKDWSEYENRETVLKYITY